MVLTYLRLSIKPSSHLLTEFLGQSSADCARTVCSGPVVFKAPIGATRFATFAIVETTTHQLSTTCFYQGFLGSWQFFLEGCRASHHGSKHSLIPTVCLNHMVIHKYLTNTELYLTFAKYDDKLLAVKTLMKNIDQQPHYSAAIKI